MASSQAKGGLHELTAVQAAGEGGMGEEEVVEVGVLLEWRNISSSILPWPDGDVATSAAARDGRTKICRDHFTTS